MKRFGLILGAFAILMAQGCGGKRAEPERLDHEMITALGQASTVKIYSYGDISLTGPYDVKLRMATTVNPNFYYPTSRSVLDNRVSEDRSKGLIPDGMTEAEYAFRVLAKSPDDFLEPTAESGSYELKDRQYAEGSGAVVGSDGIILTNTHVVSDTSLPGSFISGAVARVVVSDLEKRYFLGPSDSTRQETIFAVARWLAPQIKATVHFTSARILFPKKRALEDLPEREEVVSPSLAELFPSHEEAIMNNTSPATVLATGEVYPGKDVAVLRCDEKNLIALSLEDSNQVSAGGNVYCFGFPGAALDMGMRAQATYLCIIHDGRVGQLMPMEGGWSMIHMNADINHGDSGGPVLNDKGHLIGLNVAGKEDAPGQNYAIPIDIVRELLKKAGVEPKPNKASEEWREALLDFYSNDKKSALDKLKDVDKMINGDLGSAAGTSNNRYVFEKLQQAQDATKKR